MDDGDSLKRFTLFLPRRIHRALREESFLRNMSMAQIIIEALTHRIVLYEKRSPPSEENK